MTDANAGGPAAIFQVLSGLQATGVLNAAIKLGVFRAVDEGARDAAAVARAIDCPERSTRILLDAAAALGLLTKTGDAYALSPAAAAHLVPGKPTYVGDVANIFASPMLFHELARLPEVVRHGGTLLDAHAETEGHPFWETFAQSSAAMAMPSGHAIAELLRPAFFEKPTARVLEVAAGSGIHGYALANALPNVALTQLDWPNVLEQGKAWQKRLGVADERVSRIAGSFFDVDWRGPYDAVLLCNVYHHFDDATCIAITKKAAAALAPGGTLVVEEFLYDPTLANPPMGAMFAVVMLLWSRRGQTYSPADMARWASAAGLGTPRVEPSRTGPSSFVLLEKA